MWIVLNNVFLSIVQDKDNSNQLLVEQELKKGGAFRCPVPFTKHPRKPEGLK